MTRPLDQIRSDIARMRAALGRPEKMVVFSDGRRLENLDTDQKLKAIAALEEEERQAQGSTGTRVRFGQHQRGDGPTGPAMLDRW